MKIHLKLTIFNVTVTYLGETLRSVQDHISGIDLYKKKIQNQDVLPNVMQN